MTEDDWLHSTDPRVMLENLDGSASARKVRLFFCAWAREVWHAVKDERSKEAVLAAEKFADDALALAGLIEAYSGAQQVWRGVRADYGGRHGKRLKSRRGTGAVKRAAGVARDAANPFLNVRTALLAIGWGEKAARKVRLCEILRDLFLNPFVQPPLVEPGWLTWQNATVVGIAKTVYEEGRFDELPVLGDALEDAGCQNVEMLSHCRGPGPHARGCRVVDLILGKE